MYSGADNPKRVGFPHSDISGYSACLPAPPSLSQATTSFIASNCLGIHHMRLFAWSYKLNELLTLSFWYFTRVNITKYWFTGYYAWILQMWVSFLSISTCTPFELCTSRTETISYLRMLIFVFNQQVSIIDYLQTLSLIHFFKEPASGPPIQSA